jgi:hypothetical protein
MIVTFVINLVNPKSAKEENIAGSIDLTAINPTGQLALIDWKPTSDLASKFSAPSKLPPYFGSFSGLCWLA